MPIKLIIMVGFPGSGKSTWANTHYPDFYRISQDDMGSRGRFFNALEAKLKEGKNVVADRCNQTKRHRERLVELGRKYGASVEVVWVATPHKIALERLLAREEHPTIKHDMSKEDKIRIYRRFDAEFEQPSLHGENLDSLEVIGPVDRCAECSSYVIQGSQSPLCRSCLEAGCSNA